MKLLKNRVFACVVMIVCIIFSICYSTYDYINCKYQEVNAIFYSDSADSIQTLLNSRIELSNKMVNLAKRYLAQDSQYITAVSDSVNALSSASSVSEKYKANVKLTESVDALYYEINNEPSLTKNDKTEFNTYYQKFCEANDKIAKSSYNSEAEQYNNMLSSFPTVVMSKILSKDCIEQFK